MSEHACYWAFTGRIPFDDEDTPFVVSKPCTEADATNSFRTWMISTALQTESSEDLVNCVEARDGAQLSDYVYITSVFRSDSPIYHC
jgi:hypothetical protein